MDPHSYNRWNLRKKLTLCTCAANTDDSACIWCTEDNPHSKIVRNWEDCKNSPWPASLTMEQWIEEVKNAPRITEKPNELLYFAKY